MSSDFLNDIEDDKGNVVLLTMMASGFAELTTIQSDKLVESTELIETEGSIASLRLLPDETGWANAEKIVDALKYWIKHTREIQGV